MNFDDTLGIDKYLHYDIFSEEARSFAEYYEWYYGCPIDYIVADMVTVVASALGKKVQIRCGGYTNYANMYMAIVGGSGSNKSMPLKTCIKPLQDADIRLVTDFNDSREHIVQMNRAIERQNKRVRDPALRSPLQPMPKERRFVMTDVTPEQRNAILSNNYEQRYGLLLYYDELSTMFDQFGRYNKGSEVGDLLTIWDNTTFSISRKNVDEPSVIVQEPCMSIIGTIQPSILCNILKNRSYIDKGFNSRWLFTMPEYRPIPMMEVREELPEFKQWWRDKIDHIINDMPAKDENGRPVTITAERGAEIIYNEWVNHIADERNRIPGDDEGEREKLLLAKLVKNCLKWVLACHYLSDNEGSSQISEKEMMKAIETMNYFRYTSMKIDKMMFSQRSKSVNQLVDKWEEAKKSGMNQTQFAKSQGVSRQYVSRILKENGGLSTCQLSTT